jgi:hypothetical protein
MGQILRGLLWSAAVSRGADTMRLSLRRARRRFVLVAVGVVFAIAGAGFLLAAGFMELADLLGAVRAGLVIGVVLLAAGAGFILSASRRAAAASADRPSHDPSALATTMIGVGRELGAAAARHPGSLVLAAFLAGLLLSGGRTRR